MKKIKETCNKITYCFSRFFEGIGNLIYWLPVIFKDAQWEPIFLLTIEKHKLTKMLDYYLDMPYINDQFEKDIEDINIAITYLDMIISAYKGETELSDACKKGLYVNYCNLMGDKALTWYY